jgi:hypothetical protein
MSGTTPGILSTQSRITASDKQKPIGKSALKSKTTAAFTMPTTGSAAWQNLELPEVRLERGRFI